MSMEAPGNLEEFAAAAMDDLGELGEIQEELGDWIYKSEGKIETLYNIDEYEYDYDDPPKQWAVTTKTPSWPRPMPTMPSSARPRPMPKKMKKNKKN